MSETAKGALLSDDQIRRAMAWWKRHETHVGRMIVNCRTAYPPSGFDKLRPELWKDAHWNWFATSEIGKAINNDH